MLFRGIVLVLFAGLWTGCGSSSFLGRRIDNFTAYYNTFYNARRSYKTGYKAIEKKDQPVDRDRYLPIFVSPSGNTANREFENAVVKSADILREHENSKWVDDALLLIGKSYFYQENIVGALQKFREVIDRKSGLEDEARFWLARTLIISRAFDEASVFLQESLVRDGVRGKWKANFRLALGELYVQRSEWESAADALASGLDEAKEKELAGRAQFLLGQIYETMDESENAIAAYKRVRRFNPRYELDFAARLSAIRVEGTSGNADKALKDLRKMERDDKNFEYRDELRFLRGRIYQAQFLADEAYNSYFDLLYEKNRTLPLDGNLKGRTHYAMAELHRDLDRDYILAAAHFDSAAVSLSRPSTNPLAGLIGEAQFTREAITDAAETKANFDRYASVYSGIAVMDSLLWLGSMSQEDFDTKILALRLERALILEEQRKSREARLLAQQFRQSSDSRDPFLTRGLPEGKIIPTKNDPTGTQSGFLFHKDRERVDDGRNSFLLRWGDRPLVPNWRRIEAVRGQPVEELIGDESTASRFDPDDPTTLPEVDTSDVPRDSLSQATMYRNRSISWLDLGNALFLALNMPDSAAVWYRKVIEENPEKVVVQRSYYALAEVQKVLGDSLSAVQINDEILDKFPESEFANRIRGQRGIQIEETEIDSSALALDIYEVAYKEWQSGRADDFINQTVLIAATFPGTDAGARALLAGGEYHLEQADADRAMILAPVSLQLPDSILVGLWPEKYGGKRGVEATDVDSKVMDTQLRDAQRIEATTVDSTVIETEPISVPDSTVAYLAEPLVADSTTRSSINGEIGLDFEADSVSSSPLSVNSVGVDLDSNESSIDEVNVSDSTDTEAEAFDSVATDSLHALSVSADAVEDDNGTPSGDLLPDGTNISAVEMGVELDGARMGGNSITFIVEDLLDVVIRDYATTAYAIKARELREAVLEFRNPPPDVPLASDTLSVRPDSLFSGQENVAVSTDSLKNLDLLVSVDSTESLKARILQSDLLAREAEADSLQIVKAARPDSTDLDSETPEKRKIVRDIEPAVNFAVEEKNWVMLDKYPDIVLDDETVDDEFENYFETSTLKPLRIRRLLDLSIVGWTVLLERVSGITESRKKAGEYAGALDTYAQRVMILKDVDPGKTELIIAWGIFASKTKTDDAVAGVRASLPEQLQYILMTPLIDE